MLWMAKGESPQRSWFAAAKEQTQNTLDRKHFSRWIFIALLAAFTFFAGSFAATSPLGATPDESFHYGIIRAYAKQYSPIVTAQTDESVAEANDVIRLPSYFYHYLMSYPFRVLDSLSLSDREVLVVLRFINVGLGLVTLVILKRLLDRITKPVAALAATALFGLLPITLITFGGLNYDNLMLPITFTSLWLLLAIRQKADAVKVVLFLALLGIGGVVKFTFLPIALVEFCYLVYLLVRQPERLRVLATAFRRMSLVLGATLLLFLGTTTLFAERYGTNILRYGSLNPPCEALHSLQACLEFPLNKRNHTAEHSGVEAQKNVIVYGATDWYKNMVRGLLYPSSFLFLRYVIFVLVIASAVAIVWFRRLGYMHREFGYFVLLLALFYITTIFVDDFRKYVQFGQPYAINGRYLLPALPFIFVLAGANLAALTRRLVRPFL